MGYQYLSILVLNSKKLNTCEFLYLSTKSLSLHYVPLDFMFDSYYVSFFHYFRIRFSALNKPTANCIEYIKKRVTVCSLFAYQKKFVQPCRTVKGT